MDISVILAVYGAERYIEECLRSLFTQTKTSGVEFILVNDSTPDRSIEIAKRIIAEYRGIDAKIIHHDVNCGVAVARQTGIDAASGEYTIHIDPDDWCDPTMLEELFEIAKSEDADILVADYFINYRNKQILTKQNLPCEITDYLEELLIGADSYLWNRLIRRRLYVENNVRFRPNISIWEDFEVMIRLASFAKKVVYHPQAYIHYRQTSTSITSTRTQKRVEQKILAISYIEQFILSQKDNIKYADHLIRLKISFKSYLLRVGGKRQKEYLSLYKDVDCKIDTHFNVRGIHKFAFKQAVAGRLFVFNGIYQLLRVKSYISNNINKVIRYE